MVVLEKGGGLLEVNGKYNILTKSRGLDDDDVLNEDWIKYRMVRSHRLWCWSPSVSVAEYKKKGMKCVKAIRW